jgi:hypothetical protein
MLTIKDGNSVAGVIFPLNTIVTVVWGKDKSCFLRNW